MTSNSSLGYPAEYYYPEYIDSRPDDPLKSPPSYIPLTTSIDNGVGSSIKTSKNTENLNGIETKIKPINKKQSSTRLALDIVTDQGLPDTDITQAVKTDPKKNLLRNPAEKNIPRLIVDDSVIKQAVRTPKIITTNLDDNFEQTIKFNQINNEKNSLANGHIKKDLNNKTKFHEPIKQETVKYIEDEQPIDDYWKKEVLINDEGVVTIEPIKYDKNTYDGPFGLTRKGSFIFYITVGIITLLAAVFLIMTGIFYGQNYPDSSSNTAKLAGMGICALIFYLGLQLILIALWHQKYSQENPTKIIKKSNKRDDSSTHLKSSMEDNEQYDHSYQQQFDYTPYGNYSSPPYVSNVNEQMLLQQPGAATGAAYYEPVVWPSNVQVEAQPDSKFFQPMDWSYGTQPYNEPVPMNTSTLPTTTDTKPKKKSHHHKKKTVEAEPPKAKFDNLFPNSTVTEAPLPVLNKAPETNELIKTIAKIEQNTKQTPANSSLTRKNSNRIQPTDSGTEASSSNSHQHHHRDRHHHDRHRHHRRHSYSSCSTCSDRSYDDFYSDVGFNHGDRHKHSYPKEKIITARPIKARTPSPPSPSKRNRAVYRDTGIGTGFDTKIMTDSSVVADLEDVPNVRDNRLEQIPVVRRTIIVEPYPAQPSSQIVVKPRKDMIGKIHLDKNQTLNNNNETIMYPSTALTTKKSKKKKKTTENNDNIIEDLKLEDVNNYDENEHGNLSTKSQKKSISSKKHVNNAFYA